LAPSLRRSFLDFMCCRMSFAENRFSTHRVEPEDMLFRDML
jgi:hypothetical protein